MDFKESCESIMPSYKKSPTLYRASAFWDEYNEFNEGQLKNSGYENFKQTANYNYYQFDVSAIRNIYLLFLFAVTPKLESLRILLRAKIKNCPRPWFRRTIYKVFLGMLYDFVLRMDTQKTLDRVKEPAEGNPVLLSYNGRKVSQDILSSALEYYSLEEATPIREKSHLTIGELGAGSGRLPYFLFNAFKNKKIKYCIFDIAPALCVSQTYLSNVMPAAKMFTFREFKDFREIEKEFNEADICFFLPYQMELLPHKIFDIFVTISNLPEMRMDQIKNYFKQIDRLTSGYYYSKQFWDHYNAQDDLRMRYIDYPALPSWKQALLRPALAQKDFFETVYKIE